jgi:surface carbohydrate biosynthesis protein
MNIYINVEISDRELDGKLLLAVMAAARGHQVIVSDNSGIDRGFRSKLFAPGIFHTKCITPLDKKVNFHKTLVQNGYLITSIDEEAGLDMVGYENFANTRYSELTIDQSSAVFAWGKDDMEFLEKFYPKQKSKLHKTGSPRIDLLNSGFLEYWKVSKKIPKRPYLLVSSNMGKANYVKPFFQLIKENRDIGYYNRDEKQFKQDFYWAAEDHHKTHSFIIAMKYLAEKNNGFDIVFRPHPVEDINAWKFYLEGIPNVHVIREGPITPWILNSFALMHSGCTTAMEAIVAKKPVVTYVPFKMNYTSTFTNNFGHHVESLEKLSIIINDIFNGRESKDQNDLTNSFSKFFSRKIYLDENQLAAEKIVKIWESLNNNQLSRSSNWRMYQCLLKVYEIKHAIGQSLRKLYPVRFSNFREDYKFSPLNKSDIINKVYKLQNILKIDEKLDCKLLGKRTILIRSF